MHSRRGRVHETSRTHDCKERKNNLLNLDLLLLRSCHLGQLGRLASPNCASPTPRGNGSRGWLRTRTQWWLELCTCSSLRFLPRLVLSRIIGTCIKLRGGCPLPHLLALQYLMQILFFLLLVAILIVRFFCLV